MNINIYVKNIKKTCNSTVGLSKYEFNNKFLSSITLLRVTLDVI